MSSSISVFLSAKLSYRLDFVYRPCMILSKRKNLINGSKQFNAFAFNLTAKIVYMKRRTQGGGAMRAKSLPVSMKSLISRPEGC